MTETIMQQPVIEVRGLCRKFGNKLALDDLNLVVPRGGVFGLIGGNGAGKTTLLKHILGMLYAQTGSVRVFGMDPVQDPVGVLGRVGYMSENRDLPNWMRVGDLMRYTQAFYTNWDEAYADDLRKMFELDAKARVKQLSRGQRARVCLLVAMAHRPELLVLDEPSSGLDPVVRRDILGAVIRTIADEGRTVLFSSHLLDEVERVADRIAIVHQGKVPLTGEMDSIKESYRKVTLRFDCTLSHAPELEGAVCKSGSGREWTYVCIAPRDQLIQSAESLGGKVIDESGLTLDDIFVANITGR